MRIFKSLNCILCKKPFSRVANEPRSPVRFFCGITMCFECREKNDWEHQCSHPTRHDNYHYRHIAYHLIDVLSQEDALVLAEDNRGYFLAKPIKIPECPICCDEYSNQIEGKKSSCLSCGHVICTQCYLEMQRGNEITCPVCKFNCHRATSPEQNQLNDFLDELPDMIRQMEEIRGCDDHQEMGQIDQMLHCSECSSKSYAYCAYTKHQGYEAMEMEVGEVSKGLQNFCKKFEGLLPELDKKLLDDIHAFKPRLTLEETLKDFSYAAVLKEKYETFTKSRLRNICRSCGNWIQKSRNCSERPTGPTQQKGNI